MPAEGRLGLLHIEQEFQRLSNQFGSVRSMAKPSSWEAILIGVFSVLLGMVAFAFSGSIFNFFFVAIIIAVLYDYSNKLNDVQQRLSNVESRVTKEGANPSSPS